MQGLETTAIGGEGGVGEVWQPARFKRLFASAGEESVSYLAPHAAFQYLPEETERLSKHRIDDIDRLLVAPGTILQTCSGRNLGPSTMSDGYIRRFYVSDDFIRITIDDARMRHFAYAFLHSSTGQGLLRRGKSGSVIDHISPAHIAAQELPLLSAGVIDAVAARIAESVRLVEEVRLQLERAVGDLEARLPPLDPDRPPKDGYTVRRSELTGRLDAVPYDPVVRSVRRELTALGGKPVREYGRAMKLERYKRVYVGSKFGDPFLSGSQMLQYQPINQQYLAARAVDDVERHRVHAGWVVYMADGRAEKGLGVPALVTSDRDGWIASEHVGRIVPHDPRSSGWLWLACRTRHAQIQIKALSIGSVVDTTYPTDMESVILPSESGVDVDSVSSMWEEFAAARALETEAIGLVDAALAEISGISAAGNEETLDLRLD